MLNIIVGIIIGGVIVTVYFKLYKRERKEKCATVGEKGVYKTVAMFRPGHKGLKMTQVSNTFDEAVEARGEKEKYVTVGEKGEYRSIGEAVEAGEQKINML